MYERLVTKLGAAYIAWMMIVTRLGGLIGGAAVVYYVSLTCDLSGSLKFHWNVVALAVVLVAVTVTVLLALWETRNLRAVMSCLHRGHPFPVEMGQAAGREAVVFPVSHHIREAFVVPLVCLPPVYFYLTWVADAPIRVLVHISIAVFMGVSCSELVTYFSIERLMNPVVRHLNDYGVVIDYDKLPSGRLHNRLIFLFTLIIVITAVMIATLAHQKVSALVNFPGRLDDVVATLRMQTVVISGCAVLMAFVLAALLARSVTTRVGDLVRSMRRVETGHWDERIAAISTDELGMVGRSFNKMVAQLERDAEVIRDLNTTLERKVEERTQELAESQQSLQESYEQDRLKTEFFSNVSHELRTPLTLILAPVENILEEKLGSLQPQQRQALDIVRRNTMRLLNLINDLLDFSKLEAGKSTLKLVPTDINEVIDELVSSASLLAVERGICLSFERGPDMRTAMMDREKIEKVVINLLSNALKFTGNSGRVDVRSSCADGQLRVSVTDTGIGVAPENHGKVFERFVQIDGSASREYEGTGLGLPLARQFVELHGGQMGLESELGKGSCFFFSIPLVPAQAPAPRKPKQPARKAGQANYCELLAPEVHMDLPVASAAADSETVLIVDDSLDILACLRTVLASDYRILEARDGEAGLRMAVEELPDIIISDVMMPRMDGHEFCSHVKGTPATQRIGFIMLTAKADLAMKIEGLEQGADDYLVKPFNPEELRARVRSLLKMRRLDRQLQKRNEELEQALAELKRTQDRLVHSAKMSSLGQLAAGVAHELNNAINAVYNGIIPLREEVQTIERTVCQTFHEMEAASPDSQEKQTTAEGAKESFSLVGELVRAIETGAKRTADIVKDLKRFAHPGQSERSMFDLHQGVHVALNLLSNKMKNRIQVHTDYCDDGRIRCSETQISQVLLNLLDNAQHAIEGQGSIYISTRRADQHLVLKIRDSGAGIPEDIQHRIFDPFFTTKDVGVGTGLGLSISYGIIKGHEGSIEVASPPPGHDRGTEFTITFPADASQDAKPKGGAADEQAALQAGGSGQPEAVASPAPVERRPS